MKEFCLVMKGFEDSSLGHVFSERLALLFFLSFFFTPAMNVTYLFRLIFLVLSSRTGKLRFHWCMSIFSYRNPTLQRKNHDDDKQESQQLALLH